MQQAVDRIKTAAKAAPRGRIAISANTSWYLYNFRAGLIRALQAEGWEVVALSPPDAYSARLEALGCRWIPLRMSLRSLSPLENLGVLASYLSAYRRLRPAAALHFTIKPVIFGSLAARLAGAKAINTITGLGAVFLRQDALTALVVALYRPALKRAGRVFFQNGEDLEAFLARRLVSPDQVERVGGSGVDLQRFAVAPPPEAERFTFLFIARLLVQKGLEDFVEAARTLDRSRVRLVVAGPTASQADGGVAQAVLDSWQAEGLVEYAGALADVRPLIEAADCIVLPTYYREGVPRVLLEAGAMGRPAIATDVVGCRDVIVDGETGLLCRPRDPADLAEAMRRMMALSPGARLEMGRKARARVEALFDERAVVAAYLSAVGRSFHADETP